MNIATQLNWQYFSLFLDLVTTSFSIQPIKIKNHSTVMAIPCLYVLRWQNDCVYLWHQVQLKMKSQIYTTISIKIKYHERDDPIQYKLILKLWSYNTLLFQIEEENNTATSNAPVPNLTNDFLTCSSWWKWSKRHWRCGTPPPSPPPPHHPPLCPLREEWKSCISFLKRQ